MNGKRALVILTLFIMAACGNEPAPQLPAFDTLTARLDSLSKLEVFKGFSVAIVDEDGFLYNRGFGYANLEEKKPFTEKTLINIASISKVSIGISLLKAVEMGLLDLDDPINKHLPFEVINPNHPNVPITVRHLATHSSSITDEGVYGKTAYINIFDEPLAESLEADYGDTYRSSASLQPLGEYLGSVLQNGGALYTDSSFTNAKPGSTYDYSNIGAALCAFVIESVAKTSYESFTKQHIFDPLGMSATGWDFADVEMSLYTHLYSGSTKLPYYKLLSFPDGGLITSSTDLGKFLSELIKGYAGNGTLLTSDSYAELFRIQLAEEQMGDAKDFAVGLFTEKHTNENVIGHSGGDPGVNTLMFFDAETRVGRIMMLNTDPDVDNANDIFWGIWNALGEYQNRL